MAEEKETTPEVPAAQEPLPKPDEGPKPDDLIEHPDDKISRAKEQADRIEAGTKLAAQQIEELRTLRVNEALGGESAAGQAPIPPKEETPQEYKDRLLKGETRGEEGKY